MSGSQHSDNFGALSLGNFGGEILIPFMDQYFSHNREAVADFFQRTFQHITLLELFQVRFGNILIIKQGEDDAGQQFAFLPEAVFAPDPRKCRLNSPVCQNQLSV